MTEGERNYLNQCGDLSRGTDADRDDAERRMMEHMGSKFGRYRVNEAGLIVRDGPEIVDPGKEVFTPAGPKAMGPTRIREWLMVDVRVAKAVPQGSRLYDICRALGERQACGVVENTLIIDLLEASPEDRTFLLHEATWPTAA